MQYVCVCVRVSVCKWVFNYGLPAMLDTSQCFSADKWEMERKTHNIYNLIDIHYYSF